MSAGPLANSARPQRMRVAALAKTQDGVRAEGKAAIKLLEGAAQIAKNANSGPETGRAIDVHA